MLNLYIFALYVTTHLNTTAYILYHLQPSNPITMEMILICHELVLNGPKMCLKITLIFSKNLEVTYLV